MMPKRYRKYCSLKQTLWGSCNNIGKEVIIMYLGPVTYFNFEKKEDLDSAIKIIESNGFAEFEDYELWKLNPKAFFSFYVNDDRAEEVHALLEGLEQNPPFETSVGRISAGGAWQSS